MSTDLQVIQSNQAVATYSSLSSQINAIERMGRIFAKSGMLACQSEDQGAYLALCCITEGMSTLGLMKKYHFTEGGKPVLRADWMRGEFRRLGGKLKIIQRDADAAEAQGDYQGESYRFRLEFEALKKEPFIYAKDGKLRKNWATPFSRTQTLWARCMTEIIRTLAPEIISGVNVEGEESDDVVRPTIVLKEDSGGAAGGPSRQQSQPVVDVVPAPPTPSAEVEEKELAAAGLAPAQPAPPSRVDKESLQKLFDIIPGELQQKATRWFVAKGALKQVDGTPELIDKLPPNLVAKIIANPALFLAQLEAFQ